MYNAGKKMQQIATQTKKTKMASANLSETTIQLINNECKKATAVQISRKISRCRANMMESNKRSLVAHPANEAAASDLAQHLKDINAQYWQASYLMEIYVAVLEEDARAAGKDADLRAFIDRDNGMRAEYEQACLVASECLAEHQNMSDIRNSMSIHDDQQPRAALMQTAAPQNTGRQYKANGEFKPDTLTKDASAGQYEFWKRLFKRYYTTSNMDLAPIEDQRGHLEKCVDAHLGTALTSNRDINEDTRIWPEAAGCTVNCIHALDKLFLKS